MNKTEQVDKIVEMIFILIGKRDNAFEKGIKRIIRVIDFHEVPESMYQIDSAEYSESESTSLIKCKT